MNMTTRRASRVATLRIGRALLFVFAGLAYTRCNAQIYVGDSGAGGSIVMSNFKSSDASNLLVGTQPSASDAVAGRQIDTQSALPTTKRNSLPSSSPELRRMIARISVEVGVSADLLHAVIAAESRYDPMALSHRGAIGLMQLLPATAKRFGALNPYIPHENVRAGAQYLKWLMQMFDGDLELVLAAYNAGEQAVVKAGRRIPPYAETLAYVPRVLGYLRCASDFTCKPA